MSKPPSLTEAQIQEQIVEGLRALGYEVLVTSARSVRQGYGADHGVPDLLVSHRSWDMAWLGLEVKRPDGPVRWSHPEQERLWRAGRTAVVRSLEDAGFAIATFAAEVLGGMRAFRVPLALLDLADRVPPNRRAEVIALGG